VSAHYLARLERLGIFMGVIGGERAARWIERGAKPKTALVTMRAGESKMLSLAISGTVPIMIRTMKCVVRRGGNP
jgi:hypothetical protein